MEIVVPFVTYTECLIANIAVLLQAFCAYVKGKQGRVVVEGPAANCQGDDDLLELLRTPRFKPQHVVVTSHAVGATGHALNTSFGA